MEAIAILGLIFGLVIIAMVVLFLPIVLACKTEKVTHIDPSIEKSTTRTTTESLAKNQKPQPVEEQLREYENRKALDGMTDSVLSPKDWNN